MNNWAKEMSSLMQSAKRLLAFDALDVQVGDLEYEVYVAHTQKQRANGLSGIRSLDLDGMLFFYPKPSYVPFTMAAMEFDLDIGWYDADGTLLKRGTFQAGIQTPLTCPDAFTYVLEVPAGTLVEGDLKVNNDG